LVDERSSRHRRIGASSGGVEALQSLLAALSDLDAIVLVVLHRPVNRTSSLREILPRELRMPVVIARHGGLLHHGVCYIAEPSQHLMVGPGLRADLLPDHRYTTRDGPVDLIAPISGLAAEITRLTGTSASRRAASSG
jgi:two-component system chemotaxis response regulator CheB